MKKLAIRILLFLDGTVAVVFVLLIVAGFLLNTQSVQQKIKTYAMDMLKEKLQTRVEIDSVSVNFLTFDVNLLGLEVEDRQQRKMLQADRFSVNVDLWELIVGKVRISDAELPVCHRCFQERQAED